MEEILIQPKSVFRPLIAAILLVGVAVYLGHLLSEQANIFRKWIVVRSIDQDILKANISVDLKGKTIIGKDLTIPQLHEALELCFSQVSEAQTKIRMARGDLEE